MKYEPRTLGWAGLSPHEAETIRCVHEALADRLSSPWQLDEHARDDVVLADPLTTQGQEALRVSGNPIAVLDRSAGPSNDYHHDLIRPLRPCALIEAMNAAGTQDAFMAEHPEASMAEHDEPPATSTPKSLAQTLHDAATDADRHTVYVIDGLGDAPLVVDAAGDRLHGPYDALSHARLHESTPVQVRAMSRVAAEALIRDAGGARTTTFAHLWRVVCCESDDTPLFGCIETTLVQLTRWPNFSTMQIPRALFRVATRAHYRSNTARALADETGIAMGQVIALLNAAWLTGYLQVTGTAPRQKAQPRDGIRGSLASRIRSRLGTV